MFEEHCLPMLRKYNLCKPPVFTTGHFTIGIAAVLGSLFVFTHIITIAITSIVTGWGGFGPLSMDLSGFFAGLGFVFICRTSSNIDSVENYEKNKWIFVWSSITLCVRVLDTLMILGIVNIPAIYVYPEGAVFWSNVFSEIVFGFSYALFALIGSSMLLFNPSDENDDENTMGYSKMDEQDVEL